MRNTKGGQFISDTSNREFLADYLKNGNYPACEGHLASVEEWECLYDAVGHDANELVHGNKNVLEKYEI